MKKKVTSKGVEYVAELRKSQMFGKRECVLSREGLELYVHPYRAIEYREDYTQIVKDAMNAYHKRIESERLKCEKEAKVLRKFEEWDGDCD